MRAKGKGKGAAHVVCVAGAALAVAQPALARKLHRRRPAVEPRSIPMRRWTRCPTLGSSGPTSSTPDAAPRSTSRRCRPRPARRGSPRCQPARCWSTMELRHGAMPSPCPGSTRSRMRKPFAVEFEAQSALIEGRRANANAAQIDRRTRADAELLTELLQSARLLRCRGRARHRRGRRARIGISLRATPGTRYRFEAVDLPGLDAAGSEAGALRAAFAVKAGDPVVAEQVIAVGRRAAHRAWRAGLCHRDHRRAGDRARLRARNWRGSACR